MKMNADHGKRPWVLWVIMFMQGVPAVAVAGILGWLLWDMFSGSPIFFLPERLLRAVAAQLVLSLVSLLFAYSGYQLWRGQRSGWLWALGLSFSGTALFVSDFINSDGSFAWDDLATAAWFAGTIAMLFLPSVRRYFSTELLKSDFTAR